MERLDKILVSQNVGSRREVHKIIKSGRVCVNGEVCKASDFKVNPKADKITLDGQALSCSEHLYIMMNKPKGVLSATNDKYAETVIDLLPPELKRRGLFPAGRLDKDTEGLLIITDDGDFAHRMLSPKNHVAKKI
ncbi:MAG: pseudouridine synthase [Clostridiales bacterium]|nr:pseudouridine synthase [Clostridiales bacterium]